MSTDQQLRRETLEAAADRVLDGTATEQDAKTVALWAKKMAGWLRARAAEVKRP